MNILLSGASGYLGRRIEAALRQAGHRVVAVSRRNGVDFSARCTPASWFADLQGIDAVINCVGIIAQTRTQRFEIIHTRAPQALFRACLQCGVRRVIQISALGADAAASTPFHQSKREADLSLAELDLDWFVLRPGLVVGGRSTDWLKPLANLPVLFLPGDGRQSVPLVHPDDVVAAVLTCLDPQTRAHRVLDLVASPAPTFEQFLRHLRAPGRAPPRRCELPRAVLETLVRLAGLFHPLARRDNLAMLERRIELDTIPFAQFLGRQPLNPLG